MLEECLNRVVAHVTGIFELSLVLGIHYMLVGSFASSLHGLARFTQDADLIVDLHQASWMLSRRPSR